MTKKEINACNGIIHSSSAAAVGGGLAQVPASDNPVITPIQLGMAMSLGRVFGMTLAKVLPVQPQLRSDVRSRRY